MAPIEAPPDGSKINLSMLIDFLLQKTYHDLTVLSELLPRKSDIERKIAIVQFAHQTRQQFVRLLALVKWAASAERVDKWQAISTDLDQQSMLFVNTADMLARMSRETLVKARLPTFCLPAAVDVLTSGTYPRLPTCIRDKIVPPDPITPVEKTKTLQRLNQVIQHRLVTSKLPPEMGNMSVADGRVKFRVEHEFEVMLTLMGDDLSIPWRLLSISLLVEDTESGDGKSLVHALQVQYIHQLVQSRLLSEENPLVDLYNCLHSFCLSLQLQVLHFQVPLSRQFNAMCTNSFLRMTKHLIEERWGGNVRIDDYAVGKKLVISYWRTISGFQQNQKLACKIAISEDQNHNPTCLSIQHFPALPAEYTQQHDGIFRVTPGELYIEKLLMLTIRAQSTVKLKELCQVLRQELSLKSKVSLDESTPSLAIQVSPNPTPAEIIVITVATRSGLFQVSLGNGQASPICFEMEDTLNVNSEGFITVLRDVRCQLYLRRFFNSTAHLPVVSSLSLPVVNLSEHRLSKLSKHRLYLQFRRHPSYCLVVEVFCKEDSNEVTTRYHLLKMKRTFADHNTAEAPTTESANEQTPKPIQIKKEGKESSAQERTSQSCGAGDEAQKTAAARRLELFLVADHMVTLDPRRITDYPGTHLTGLSSTNFTGEQRKRKLDSPQEDDRTIKQQRTLRDVLIACRNNSTYDAALGHIVSLCHARLPFTYLREELSRHKIIHQGLSSEGGVGLAVRLSSLPLPKDCDHSLVSSLQQNVLDCVLRFPDESQRICLLEMTFDNCPLEGFVAGEKGSVRRAFFEYSAENVNAKSTDKETRDWDSSWYKSVVNTILNDWCSVCKLYGHAVELDSFLKDTQSHLRHVCRVYSYNYKKLTLQYDPDRKSLVTFEWSVEQAQFVLTFGHCGATVSGNPHSLTSSQLQQEFNKHQSLPYILQILHDTFRPLSSIAKLSRKPVLGMQTRPLMPLRNFAVLPQSSTNVLLVYRNTNYLEIRFRSKNLVAVRDASYSAVDPTKYKAAGLWSVPNVKAFLQLYVDEVAKVGGITSRHTSTADDEAPPSPITMETDASVIEPQFTPPQTIPTATNITASPVISRTSPQAPPGSVNVPSPFSASPSVNSPGNIYSVQSPVSQLSTFLQPSPAALQGSVQSPIGSLGYPVPSPAPGHQFVPPSPAVGGSSPALSHNMPITSPGSWPMSPQFAGSGQAVKYRSAQTSQAASGAAIKQTTPPPRPLTARTWAATVPTILSHAAFNKLCSPAPAVSAAQWGSAVMLCPLERFLGCMTLKRHLVRVVHGDDMLILVRNDPNCLAFKASQPNTGLQYYVSVDSSYTSLRLSAKLIHGQESSWKEDLNTLEKFFETRVACAPYKTSSITAFARLLGAPSNILRDCIKIMKLEINPDPTCNWRVEWCLSIPPSGPEIAPPGTPAVVLKGKMLFFIQLSKPIPSSPGGEEQIVVIPIVHDLQNNTIQQAEIQRQTNPAAPASSVPSTPAAIVNAFLKRWSEITPRTGECVIYPAVLELARNLVIPP